ncbi:MAG: undecaprenyl-diphosphate phosphatase [bacterium]
MKFFEHPFLGLVQGLTEFLPVSSSGHLAVIENLFGFKPYYISFDIFLHVATLFAVLFYFHKLIWKLIKETRFLGQFSIKEGPRIIILLIISTAVTGVIGVLGKHLVYSSFGSSKLIAVCFFSTGILLFLSERYKHAEKSINEIPLWHGIVIGLFQSFALMPGLSRSGLTIAAAFFLGWNKEKAFEFSFLLAVPAILGAVLFDIGKIEDWANIFSFSSIVGYIVAFASGLLALRWLRSFVLGKRLHLFSYYLFVIGIAVLIFV